MCILCGLFIAGLELINRKVINEWRYRLLCKQDGSLDV